MKTQHKLNIHLTHLSFHEAERIENALSKYIADIENKELPINIVTEKLLLDQISNELERILP